MTTPSMEWGRHDWTGTAADFHAMDLPAERAMWWCHVVTPTVILGSTQSVDDVNQNIADESGVLVSRRRSGGGAVFVHPSDSVWIDITISRNDPLWKDDVAQSMLWLGELFVEALSPWVQAEVYRDSFSTGIDGRVVCFASSSPGEVLWDQTNWWASVKDVVERVPDSSVCCIDTGDQVNGRQSSLP